MARLQNALALISLLIRSIVIKFLFLRAAGNMQVQSLIKYGGDQNEFADLHSVGAWCFYATPLT